MNPTKNRGLIQVLRKGRKLSEQKWGMQRQQLNYIADNEDITKPDPLSVPCCFLFVSVQLYNVIIECNNRK